MRYISGGMKGSLYYGQTQEKKYIFRKARLRTVSRRCFCRIGEYLAVSVPCCQIWRRNLFTDLHHSGTDLWLYHDYGRDFSGAYDKKKSGRGIPELREIQAVICRRLDQRDHPDSHRSLLFCNRRMGHQISGRIRHWTGTASCHG